MPKLTQEQFEQLRNPYLFSGYKKDQVNLKELTIEKNLVLATLEVEFIFFEQRMGFHFSSIQAYIWVQQLCSIYALWDNQCRGYSFVLEDSINFHSFITKRCFDLRMDIKGRKSKDITFYKLAADFDEGKITGNAKFIFSPVDLTTQIQAEKTI